VTPIAAEELVTAGAPVIDVREPDEWSAGHAPQARPIPLGQVEARLDEVRTESPALIVCRSGGRSNAVAQMLNARGINAVNLAGGMQAWEQAGLPVVTEAGGPGRIV
jgi:rhodanese-related sulfurtransferase